MLYINDFKDYKELYLKNLPQKGIDIFHYSVNFLMNPSVTFTKNSYDIKNIDSLLTDLESNKIFINHLFYVNDHIDNLIYLKSIKNIEDKKKINELFLFSFHFQHIKSFQKDIDQEIKDTYIDILKINNPENTYFLMNLLYNNDRYNYIKSIIPDFEFSFFLSNIINKNDKKIAFDKMGLFFINYNKINESNNDFHTKLKYFFEQNIPIQMEENNHTNSSFFYFLKLIYKTTDNNLFNINFDFFINITEKEKELVKNRAYRYLNLNLNLNKLTTTDYILINKIEKFFIEEKIFYEKNLLNNNYDNDINNYKKRI